MEDNESGVRGEAIKDGRRLPSRRLLYFPDPILARSGNSLCAFRVQTPFSGLQRLRLARKKRFVTTM